jgi:hypothetical protein
MQATLSRKRLNPGHWKIAALAVAIAGSFLAGAMTVTIVDNDSAPAAVIRTSARIDPAIAERLEREMLLAELFDPIYGAGSAFQSGARIDPSVAARLEYEMLLTELYRPGASD